MTSSIQSNLILHLIVRLNNPDHIKKRSKLVLPKPQVSDAELEEVIKLLKLMQEKKHLKDSETRFVYTVRLCVGCQNGLCK